MTSEAENLKTEVAVLKEKIVCLISARDLQAAEYHRRLDELNHAHAKAEQKNADYLPRELFEQTIRELSGWRHEVDKELAETRGSKAGIAAAVGLAISMLALSMSAFQIVRSLLP